MKLTLSILLVLFLALQYSLWFDPSGILATIELHNRLDKAIAENNELATRNRRLANEVVDLKSGQESIEEHARSDLGMVKPNETYYQYVD